MNDFLNEMNKNGRTENGALSYNSSLSTLVDQFGNAATYRNRTIDSVFIDQASLWSDNPELALRFPFYLRMVTRKINYFNNNDENGITKSIQKGQGVKDESLKRYLWLAKYHKDTFENNLWAIPLIGSWKDIWTLLYYDKIYEINVLDKRKIFSFIKYCILNSPSQIEFIKKYLPRIRSNKKCITTWSKITNQLAKDFCKFLDINQLNYRKFKTTGKLHDFQRLICNKNFDELDFNKIPGRALSILVKGEFLQKHDLVDKYTNFIKNREVAPFTGYPYELLQNLNIVDSYQMPLYKKITIDKQFEYLLNKAKDEGNITENVLCCLDTSSSMNTFVNDKVRAIDVAISLSIYFSSLNTGEFKNKIMAFDETSKLISLNGTFSDKVEQIYSKNTFWGSTNFQSVIDEIVKIRTNNPNIPINDYPTTILAVSDMQFNPTKYRVTNSETTNLEEIYKKLHDVFPSSYVSSIKFIWWQVNGNKNDVPATINNNGNILISGFDGSIISMIIGEKNIENNKIVKKNISMEDVAKDALNQEILLMIK